MTEPSPSSPPPRPEMDDAPPLLGKWRNIYALVLGLLVVYVVVFTAITWTFT